MSGLSIGALLAASPLTLLSVAFSMVAGGTFAFSALPVGIGRIGFYRILAHARTPHMAALSVIGVVCAAPDFRTHRLARASLWAAIAAGILNATAAAVLLRLARRRAIPLSLRAALSMRPPRTPSPTSVVTFARGDGWSLEADVYAPTHMDGRPCVVLIHGGGWTAGDKGEGAAWSAWIAEHGYVVVDAQYRLAPTAAWRDSVDDVQRAVAWVRGHAAELGGDPRRVVLMGRSAGGHLALLAAYTAAEPPLAVVALYAPTDLARLHDHVPALRGGMPEASSHWRASPLAYVRAHLPSTLLIHGTWDDVVAVDHTRLLAKALAAQGAPVETLLLPMARHAFDVLPYSLASQLARGEIVSFLRRTCSDGRDEFGGPAQ